MISNENFVKYQIVLELLFILTSRRFNLFIFSPLIDNVGALLDINGIRIRMKDRNSLAI